jgi:predicted RNA binding protein YcfA (HicA-like mRNA interferase family)
MTPHLPMVSAQELVKILKKAGFKEVRQKGSHLYLYNSEKELMTTVPMHSGDIGRGLLKTILKQAGIKEADFRA